VNGRAACDFIRRHQKSQEGQEKPSPFFLYVAFNAPHGPLQATEKYLSRFTHIADEERRTYAAMVSALDDAVGTILAELRTTGQEEDTLIFFLSDNGGPLDRNGSLNTPLTGEKGGMLEGGIRTPYLVQWRAGLPAGKVYEQPVSSLDITATACSLALQSRVKKASEFTTTPTLESQATADPTLESQATWDGVNLIPYLKGERQEPPHPVLFWRMKARDIWAIRMGEWKLLTHRGWHDLPPATPKPRLIHLTSDPQELHDLSEKEPAKLAELQTAYDTWAATLPEPLWTTDVSPEATAARQKRAKRTQASEAKTDAK
jgi:arylsulfatase A-like enzyme